MLSFGLISTFDAKQTWHSPCTYFQYIWRGIIV